MNKEYIEREALLDLLKVEERYGCLDITDIKSIPAADVTPIVHGRWKRDGRYIPYCTACKKEPLSAIRPEGNLLYCPNCGAQMDDIKE